VRLLLVGECEESANKPNSSGYPATNVTRFGKRIYTVHVRVWVDYFGRLPSPGMQINHHCDNRACVNIDHLYEGSQLENMHDASVRRRLWQQQLTHCLSGHVLTGDNLVMLATGQRGCRSCMRRYSTAAKRKKGVRPRSALRSLTDEQVEEVRSRVANGEAKKALAREFGVSPRCIFKWVQCV